MIFNLFCALLFLPAALTLHVPASDNAAGSQFAPNEVYNRPMRAARRYQELSTRNLKGSLSHDHHLHYVDENTHASNAQFAAKVGIGFEIPAVVIEDIDDHIEQVECHGSTIYLYFRSEQLLRDALEEFKSVGNFLVITSHDGCNEDGEREPHMVNEFSLNLKERLIVLSVSRVPWSSTLNTMKVDFGESAEHFELRRHRSLQPRQAASTTSGAAAASTSVDYPPAPTFTPTSHNATANINKQYLDTSILPPDSSLGQITASGPKIPASFNIKCKNCTIQGSIELVAGSFTMASLNSNSSTGESMVNVTEGIVNYIEHGYLEFRSNNFMAHVELDSTIGASEQLIEYTAPLPSIPITPFVIPGIASVGPLFVPQLSVGFQLSTSFEFTYGFDMVVPNNSTITLNIGNRTQSSQQGFDNTTITAIPFQAASAGIALTTTGGFQPQLLAGISLFSNHASMGAGLFLNLPKLTATFSTLSHVNAACETANTTSNIENKALDIIYDSLTHIDASVDLGLGVIAEAEVDFGDYSFKDRDPYTVLSTGFALPTACVSFDGGKKTFGVPSATSSGGSGSVAASAIAKAAGGHSGGAGLGDRNLIGQYGGVLGRGWTVMGLLGGVSVCFMLF